MKHLALVILLLFLPLVVCAQDFSTFSSVSHGLKAGKEILSHDLESLPNGWPCEGEIKSGFGMRDHPVFHVPRHHDGIDIAAPTGTPIYATGGGRVVFTGKKIGYGLTVDIEHGPNVKTRYAHLSVIKVKKGDVVTRGDLIGLVGQTGITTGPHLHYEVQINGAPVDPEGWL